MFEYSHAVHGDRGCPKPLRAIKSYRFEKLKGDRQGDYSIRLNDQFRLTFPIEEEDGGNRLVILDIEDYH